MKLRKVIGYADCLPPYYGVAYLVCDTAVCYPVPLNVIVGKVRWLWWTLAGMYSMSDIEAWNPKAYKRGRDEGWSAAMKHMSEHGSAMQKAVVTAMLSEMNGREQAKRWREAVPR